MQTIQGDGFIVTIIKSRRKTAALKIKDGKVSLHISTRLPLTLAKDFVEEKTPWIKRKLLEHADKQLPTKQFIDGELFLVLGKEYHLKLVESVSQSVIKTIDHIEIHGSEKQLSSIKINQALTAWYLKQATLYLNSRTAELADRTNLNPSSIKVKHYKARWGSCSIKAEINYNWKLFLAPPHIIDYVIIHELCHIQHHNHSKNFWLLVELHCPEYKSSRLWLKSHGHTLDIL